MIPKSHLVPGVKYIGKSRSTTEAVWDGYKFHFIQTEWYGDEHNMTIKHPEDDNVHDVFEPIAEDTTFRVIPKHQMKQARWYKVFGTVERAMWVDGMFLYDWGSTEKEAHHLDDGTEHPFLPYAEIIE